MTKLIQIWDREKQSKGGAHRRFVRRLKEHQGKHLDRWGNELHQQVFSEIDCLDCANCCRSIPPLVNKADISRMAKYFRMKPARFEEEYVTLDEDGDQVLNMTPCVFLLEDNRCQIYEIRPKACREYPHTGQLEFSGHLRIHGINSSYCPAVFHILERMIKGLPT